MLKLYYFVIVSFSGGKNHRTWDWEPSNCHKQLTNQTTSSTPRHEQESSLQTFTVISIVAQLP